MAKSKFTPRRKPFKDQLPVIYIYCEGKNTEPDYFKIFRVKTAKIKAIGVGDNTLSLVDSAITAIKNENFEPSRDQKWCVFDKDDYFPHQFDNAITKAENNGFGVAWSNQAFEYWLLLHFEDHKGAALQRDQYKKKINKYIDDDRNKYNLDGRKKVSDQFANILFEDDMYTGKQRVIQAIERAIRLCEEKKDLPPSGSESCTTVYKLVKVLLKYSE